MEKKKYKPMTYYMKLPWTFETSVSDDPIEPWTTRVKELPGCMSHGKAPEKSLIGIKDAIKSYILATMKLGEDIPEPLKLEAFKGVLTYRTSPERHYEIARRARQLGLSVNKLMDAAVEHELQET